MRVRQSMKRKQFTEEQIREIRWEQEAGVKTGNLTQKHGVSETTMYNWKAKFGGMYISHARRIQALWYEKDTLNWLLANDMLDNTALKDLQSKDGEARRRA